MTFLLANSRSRDLAGTGSSDGSSLSSSFSRASSAISRLAFILSFFLLTLIDKLQIYFSKQILGFESCHNQIQYDMWDIESYRRKAAKYLEKIVKLGPFVAFEMAAILLRLDLRFGLGLLANSSIPFGKIRKGLSKCGEDRIVIKEDVRQFRNV
ncbi:hypothetical protein IEQ34_016048 [Dendrobium chrysotoxum]|uniref:Uncharacterized protein n=1 Tax=Dendrobium chrysotoxum TaxID=161865 RepID=A0AAV7FX02_DENCH|nr:hypothetical protein IEQ34_016048 [Dendrobium chrysotoxum]